MKYNSSDIYSLIDKQINNDKIDTFSIYISYPPFKNETVEKRAINDMQEITNYARNYNLHVQDDL